MTTILHVAPLLLLNIGSYILIKLIGLDSLQGRFLLQGVLLVLLGVSYVSMTLMWLWLGKRYQLSYIYPLVGLNYVIAVFVGMWAFGEPFTWHAMGGALIITLGVVLISSTPHRHEPSNLT